MIGQIFISLIGIDDQTKHYKSQAAKLAKAKMELMYANPYRRHLNLKTRVKNIDIALSIMQTVYLFRALATNNNIPSEHEQQHAKSIELLHLKRRLLEIEYNNCIKPTEVKGGFTK